MSEPTMQEIDKVVKEYQRHEWIDTVHEMAREIATLRTRLADVELEAAHDAMQAREALVRELRVTNASAQKALANARAEADRLRAVVEAAREWSMKRNDSAANAFDVVYAAEKLCAALRALDGGT